MGINSPKNLLHGKYSSEGLIFFLHKQFALEDADKSNYIQAALGAQLCTLSHEPQQALELNCLSEI